ncbi:GAF domain-containing protein [bacterium]|nr:MAG: GAF domain-containing protein [bacterium]
MIGTNTEFILKTKQELNCKIIRTMLNYVFERKGESCAKEFIQAVDLDEAYIRNENNWVSFDTYTRGCEFIKKVFDDDTIFYKIGIYSFSNPNNFGTMARMALRLLTPNAIFKKTAEIANHAVKFGKYRVAEFDKNRMVLEFKNAPNYPFYQHNCDYRLGLFAGIPQLFGLPIAKHRHLKCVSKGDDRCEYEFIWQAKSLVLFRKHAVRGFLTGSGLSVIFFLMNSFGNIKIQTVLTVFTTLIFYLLGVILDMRATAKDNALISNAESNEIEETIAFANQKYKEASETVRKLEAIIEANAAFSLKLLGSELIDVVLNIIKHSLGYDRAMIMMVDETGRYLSNPTVVSDETERDQKSVDLLTIDLNDNNMLFSKVVQSGEPILISNVDQHPELKDRPAIKISGTKSFVVLPLKFGSRVRGIISIDRLTSAAPMNQEDVKILSTLMTMLSVVLENVELYQGLEVRVRERTAQLFQANTELEKAYGDLMNAQTQLIHSEKMAGLGKLVAGIAHEMNNPAGILSGYVELVELYANRLNKNFGSAIQTFSSDKNFVSEIEQFKKLLAEINACLDPCKRSIVRMKNIVQDLRNFSRLDENELMPADLNEGIEKMLQFFRNQTQNQIKIITNLTPLPLVHCFPGHLNQVFSNMILNSIEAIKGDGTITISTKVSDENEFLKTRHVRIDIADTGTGIKPENVDKIYDPFYTTKDIGQGQGLGLAIAYGIVSRHNGKILVKSEYGKGTNMTILIPVEFDAVV